MSDLDQIILQKNSLTFIVILVCDREQVCEKRLECAEPELAGQYAQRFAQIAGS